MVLGGYYLERFSTIFLVLILGCINWLATSLGGLLVFVCSKKLINSGYSNILGFSAGIMLSASFWSLLLPSVEMAISNNQLPGSVVCIGFILGVLFLFTVSELSHEVLKKTKKYNRHSNLLIAAISLHNIPEGFIVGVLCSGLSTGDTNIDLISAITLSLSIGLQNIPEGLAISLPLRTAGHSKFKSFYIAQLTGLIEPVSAIFGYFFISQYPKLLPYSLAFAGGAMIYVIINEMVPEFTKAKSRISIILFSFGFMIMMALDTILSGFQ